LLHGGSPLAACGVPLPAPPSLSAVAPAEPSPLVAVRFSGAGALACAPGGGVVALGEWLASPAADWVVVVFDPGPPRDAAFLSYGGAPRPLPDSPQDFVPHHRADASDGDRYGSPAPPPAGTGPAAGSDLARSAALSAPAGRDGAVNRPANADLAAAALSVIISPQTVSAAVAQGAGVCTLVSSAGSAAPLAVSLGPRARGGDAGEVIAALGRNPVGGAESESAGTGERAAGQRDGPVPSTEVLALPQVQGLLTEGAHWGLTALGRAAGALTEPLVIEGGSADVLYWLGCSTWVVAVALACEGVRRWRARRPDDVAPFADPRPEMQP
jgi:hypothetical protein